MTNPFACIANDTARYFTHRDINCMTKMGPYSINGYIELPEKHPWIDFPDTLEVHPDIEVHGGITYQEGRVIGFDTNHLGDGQHPDAPHTYPSSFTGHTWAWEEVETETRKLADQAKDTTMPNPTRENIIEAHKALTNLLKLASGKSTAAAIFNERIVRDALPPKPQPTMAEIKWDDDKHYLAEAETEMGTKVIMLWETIPERIAIIEDGVMGYVRHEALTPTGKRYTLTEVETHAS